MKQTSLEDAIAAMQTVKAELQCPGLIDKETATAEAQLVIDYLQAVAATRAAGEKMKAAIEDALRKHPNPFLPKETTQ